MKQEQIDYLIARKKIAIKLVEFFKNLHFDLYKKGIHFELDISGRKIDEITIGIHGNSALEHHEAIDSFLKENITKFFELQPLNVEYVNYELTTWNKYSFFYNFKVTTPIIF